MNPNSWHPSGSPYPERPHSPPPFGNPPYVPRPFVPEDTLRTAEIQVERKFFVLTLKENVRGRFLRITEEVGGKRNTIIIPSTGLEEFQRVLNDLVQAAAAAPPPVMRAAPVEDPDAIGNR